MEGSTVGSMPPTTSTTGTATAAGTTGTSSSSSTGNTGATTKRRPVGPPSNTNKNTNAAALQMARMRNRPCGRGNTNKEESEVEDYSDFDDDDDDAPPFLHHMSSFANSSSSKAAIGAGAGAVHPTTTNSKSKVSSSSTTTTTVTVATMDLKTTAVAINNNSNNNNNHHHTVANGTNRIHKQQQQQNRIREIVEDCDNDDDDEEINLAQCLHCRTESTEIQVRCDECSAYICDSCHWCHEFQANHEIRVCDRCDSFYCRNCDEVDQCDDCAEVVCASCSTLLSCKFCGGGICEECATSCGRCGIVLCSRDAKFAVECDTCRLSYCLVCLASGSKDPCVRCRTRPSKRMEQLVHLRLKSIYKAFKQNSSSTTKSTNARERQNDDPDEDHVTDDPEALFQAAASAAKTGALKKRNCSKYHKRNDSTGSGNSFDKVIRFKEEKEKADAAASALLAELEEEEEAEKTKVGRKNKKKKKKDKNPSKNDFEADALDNHSDEISSTGTNEHVLYSDEEARNDDRKQPPTQGVKGMVTESTGEVDPYEKELCRLVAVEDMEGLENLMETIKGIPGRAILRKNAKKALKRMRLAKEPIEDEPGGESPAGNIATVEEEDHVTDLQRLSATTGTGLQLLTSEHSNLLKILSYTHNKQQSQLTVSSAQHTTNPGRTRMASTGPLKSECVMHMAPSIVGWVIGKGGQRIRDLMEENSVRVWIDQSSMGASDPRMVYVSGLRQNVDTAVERIKELVSNAPTPITRQVVPLVEPTDTTTVQAPPKLDVSDDRIPSLKPKFGTVNVQAITSTNDRVTNDNRSRHVMTCEPRFVALLIGRRGWTIKNIQDTTGVKVDIDQTVSPRKITISGNGEDDIENAIRMVQDVLSYPHAQLQPGMEHSQLIAHASILNMDKNAKLDGLNGDSLSPEKSCFLEQCTPPVESTTRTTSFQQAHTPPPSSLIMTGDARTSTSTTSSLSTTPEPGALLQSTIQSPYAEVETGAFISPQHSRTLFSGDTNQLSLNQMSSLSPLAAHPIYHPQPLHNFQSSRDNVYGSLPLSGQPIHATGPLLHHSSPNQHTHSTFRSSVQNDFIPLTSARDVPVRNPNIPYQSSQNIYHDNGGAYYNDEPISSFWNATSSGIRTPSGPDSFRLDAAVDFLEHSKLHSTMVVGTLSADVNEGLIGLSHTPDIPQQSIAKQDQSLSVQTGGDDAQMIDSLFGPALTVNDPQLLTGLQGISLHDESTSIGLWGSSHNANDTGLKSLLEAPERDEPLVLAGMQQTLLAAERKSQSRFAWGEHNGH